MLIIAENQMSLKRRRQLIDCVSGLHVAVSVRADHVDLARTAILLAQEEWNLDPIASKWNSVLDEKLCRMVADARVGGAAQLYIFIERSCVP